LAFGEKQLYNFLKQKHKLINELDCDMNPPEDKINIVQHPVQIHIVTKIGVNSAIYEIKQKNETPK
jgi:hypothetical protein